ncbi:MAG: LysR family transcriptional regulator [Elusimicrobiota bacterium]|jgi:LysR family transcriptional activator of nhaA
MIPINFHHLYYFWITVKAGSITAAKANLLLSHSALSMQLMQLEKNVGKKLLYRGHVGVSPTPDGSMVFQYCERMFSQGNDLIRKLRAEAGASLPMRIGSLHSISDAVNAQTIGFLQQINKDTRATLAAGAASEISRKARRSELDLIISDSDLSDHLDGRFTARHVASIPICFVASPSLARRIKRFPHPNQRISMFFRPIENVVRQQVMAYAKLHRLRIKVKGETDNPDILRLLALRGRCVVTQNLFNIQDDLERKRLVVLNQRPTGIKKEIWLHFDPSTPQGADIGRRLAHLRFHCKTNAA